MIEIAANRQVLAEALRRRTARIRSRGPTVMHGKDSARIRRIRRCAGKGCQSILDVEVFRTFYFLTSY
jgi:hypothetical protein